MSYDYGFGPLENKLIDLLRTGEPDFAAAEELIAQGADVNAVGSDDDSNVLSQILEGYVCLREIPECKQCDHEKDCSLCEHNDRLNSKWMEDINKIIHFFLAHGFDVHKQNDCFGAQCLFELTLTTFDRHMIAPIKTLLDAGATNRTVSEREGSTPRGFVGTEASYQHSCMNDYRIANIYEAAYQIYLAAEEGRPYDGIDSYELALGKQITKVLAKQPENGDVFYDMHLPEFEHKNCFNTTLYLVYDGGCLVITEYADFWTDTIIPDEKIIDVSEQFPGVVGHTIEQISFEHSEIIKANTRYSRPITTIQMSSGVNVVFCINLGEVKKDDRAAYYRLVLENRVLEIVNRLWQLMEDRGYPGSVKTTVKWAIVEADNPLMAAEETELQILEAKTAKEAVKIVQPLLRDF